MQRSADYGLTGTIVASYHPKDRKKPVVNTQFGFGYAYTGALSSDM